MRNIKQLASILLDHEFIVGVTLEEANALRDYFWDNYETPVVIYETNQPGLYSVVDPM
jgi:hypothetical protein